VESKFVVDELNLRPGVHSIADFGCGIGRHAVELGRMGFSVLGLDYVDTLIQQGRQRAAEGRITSTEFLTADCRDADLQRTFDAILCLYDVVGSFADQKDNIRILKNIERHLKPGGVALISVMNMALTVDRGKNFFSLSKEPDRLLSLKPSHTMEKTGDIFDPDYYLIDEETMVVYRKEQFDAGTSLPTEVIVRDRRYYTEDIEAHCRNAGLDVVWSRFVRAGDWQQSLALNDRKAKEILLLCRKPTARERIERDSWGVRG